MDKLYCGPPVKYYTVKRKTESLIHTRVNLRNAMLGGKKPNRSMDIRCSRGSKPITATGSRWVI